MKAEGVVIVGAAGALGERMSSVASKKAQDHLFLFDQCEDSVKGIAACDLAKRTEVAAALQRIDFEACSCWRLLVTSGLYDGATKGMLSWESIEQSLAVNLLGVVQFVCGFVEKLKAANASGRIVLVSSAAASVGSRDIGYGVGKAGLNGLVRSLSKQQASEGISVIGVVPGLFDSPMSAGQDPKRKQEAISATHTKRPIGIEEVAACTSFALFDAPDSLTGTFLNISGGQVA